MSFVAAAIAGGTALIGGVVSSSNNRAASREAVNASQQATNENNALARDIFGQNKATLAPFVQQGGAATAYINQLLGIAPQPQAQATGGTTRPFANPGDDFMAGFGGDRGGVMGMGGFGTMGQMGQAQPVPTAPANDASAGFDAFRNSTGYNFRFNEGMRAITGNQAARGLLNSGDTLKRLNRFGQDTASNEFVNFFNALAGQQSVGLNAANAQAGVASNFSSQVQQNNAQNASNVGNAALARAGNNNAFLSSLIGAGASIAGGR